MFVRKLRNRSGSTSVQVIDKSSGKYRVVETVGTSSDPEMIAQLVVEARSMVARTNPKQRTLFPCKNEDTLLIESFLQKLNNSDIRTVGPELIFGTLFDRIGFNTIPEEMFRHLVVTRLAHPVSKLKTVDYLYRYQGTGIMEDALYKFLDRFVVRHKETAERIAYAHTQKTLKDISVVFYDMTTLYFEAEDEDDLRKIGFSKDGKFQKPQIMLGLLVGENGYPIGYDIFEGNTFEGHTLLPVLEGIQKKYGLPKPVVIADAGLLSRKNLENLSGQEYSFIIGARIRNESDKIKEKIIKKAIGIKDGDCFIIRKKDGTRLIVSYSDKRAKKDAHNRERGLRKLRQRVKSGKLTKENINNRGYNKFLSLSGEVEVAVDEEKVDDDKKWDGLKGYVTNTSLRSKTVIENYHHLWQIEKAFRISKTDLRIRPIHHYKKRRIEAHICIAFVAYAIWKELERLLKKNKINMSPKRAGELTHNMYRLECILPGETLLSKILLGMDDEQKQLFKIVTDG
jgi:transposase